MVIFNSYVKLPEGISSVVPSKLQQKSHQPSDPKMSDNLVPELRFSQPAQDGRFFCMASTGTTQEKEKRGEGSSWPVGIQLYWVMMNQLITHGTFVNICNIMAHNEGNEILR